MILLKTKNYGSSVKTLPEKIKRILITKEILLIENIFHPKLHTKKLKGFLGPAYSFRITSTYRGIFRISETNIVLFAIGHRKDVYK